MRIVHDWPPFYDQIAWAVGVPPLSAVFTYGDAVYTLAEIDKLPADLDVHERVHVVQQEQPGMDPRFWWMKWVTEPEFRLDQELKAYRAQYQFNKKGLRDYANALATIYGFNMSEAKAKRMITQ